MSSFTRRLVERALAHGAGAVPEAALDVGKRSLVDTLAVALGARDERVVRAVTALATELGAAPEQRAASLWGSGRTVDPARAALVNGTAAHALDFDDFCWAMNTHASAVLWPAALAVAEASGKSGRAALLGYVAGFEAAAVIGGVLGKAHYGKGWHPTSTIGTLGAAVTAGVVLGLDESQLRTAVGIAVSRAAGSRMNFGTDTKPLHAGLAAEAGVTAALLARHGVTANDDGIDAPMGLSALYDGEANPSFPSPERFALVDPGMDVKPYPSCRFTHRVIDAVLALRAPTRRGGRTATSLECEIDPFALGIVVYDEPRTGLEGKFSMTYCARVAWLHGFPGVAEFTDASVSDVAKSNDLPRVTVRPREGTTDIETVTARYSDGSSDVERVRFATGSPSVPLGPDAFDRKILACAEPALGAARARRLSSVAVAALESGTPDGLPALFGLLNGLDAG